MLTQLLARLKNISFAVRDWLPKKYQVLGRHTCDHLASNIEDQHKQDHRQP